MKCFSWIVLGCLWMADFCLLGQSIQEDQKMLFGTQDKGGGGLIAIIYDLKQKQNREPSNVSAEDYPEVIHEFLKLNWDEQVLNRFFRVTQPLYSTQIFIPRISADLAPQAYGVQEVMKPTAWCIHYKGQVSPPEDGTYRFAAYADDVIAVAVNGKSVCVAGRPDMQMKKIWSSKEDSGQHAFNGSIVYGEWVEMKKDQPVDLDVLVGERPGGDFCAFLMYQKQGEEYRRDGSGKLILPVFQLARMPIPDVRDGRAPLHAGPGAIWKSHQ